MSQRVARPDDPRCCWSLVKVSGGGGAHQAPCPQRARDGFLTCAAHRKHEEEARLLREQLHEPEGVLH
jgi:hypothetical protein